MVRGKKGSAARATRMIRLSGTASRRLKQHEHSRLLGPHGASPCSCEPSASPPHAAVSHGTSHASHASPLEDNATAAAISAARSLTIVDYHAPGRPANPSTPLATERFVELVSGGVWAETTSSEEFSGSLGPQVYQD
jgi:hypothetical protein